MTGKERIKAVLEGKKPDRIPWSPNLAYWWQFQDRAFLKKGETQVLEDMGATPLIRAHMPCHTPEDWEHIQLFDMELGPCAMDTLEEGDRKVTTFTTPKGSLKAIYRKSEQGDTWFLTEHPVQCEEDYEILSCFYEHMRFTPNHSRFLKAEAEVGDRGLVIGMLMPEPNVKSAFQALLEFWVGTEQLVYDLCDFPEVVEGALERIIRADLEAARISADSPCEYFLSWEDSSTSNLSPELYEKYIFPEINAWCDILHAKGKKYIQHACGHLKHLLPIMARSKIDAIESITPSPVGDIEMAEAARILPERIALIGGIDAVTFGQLSGEELYEFSQNLVKDLEGTRFILANSDSCPPGIEYEKFVRIGQAVSQEI